MKRRFTGAGIYICGGLAMAAMVALIAFFVHILVLNTAYRAFCLDINDAVLASDPEYCTVEQYGEVFPADTALIDYYDRFLLGDGVTPFERKERPVSEGSITLRLNEGTLSLTEREDGTAIHLRWETPDGVRCFTVRSERVTFRQLDAYLQTYMRRL